MAALVSEAFNLALKESHTVISQLIMNNGTSTLALDIVNGNVKQNYDAVSRWATDVEFLVPESYVPSDLQNLLQQHLSTLTPYRGIQFADGTQELIKQATMFPTNVHYAESAGGAPTLKVAGFDQSVRCQGNIAVPFYISNGTLPNVAVPTLLARKQPTMKFQLAQSNYAAPNLLVTEDSDAWAEAQRIMSAAGQDLFLNRNDVCQSSQRALVPDSSFVWHYDENNNADFDDTERDATNDLFPNVINVVGTNPAAPGIFGQAADMDPSSATYRYGANGEQVRSFSSELITTNLQATQMATYLLGKLLGPQDEVTFQAIPNPALDVGDTVAVTRVSMGLNQTRMIVVDIDLPLQADNLMKLTCRRSIYTDTQGTPIRP